MKKPQLEDLTESKRMQFTLLSSLEDQLNSRAKVLDVVGETLDNPLSWDHCDPKNYTGPASQFN